MAQRPDQVLSELLAAMAEEHLDVALIGGYAVVTWGVPRATFDIDLLVEADDERLARVFGALERRGFGVDAAYKSGWRDKVRDMTSGQGADVPRWQGGIRRPLPRCDRLTAIRLRSLSDRAATGCLSRCASRVPCRSDPVKLLADRPKDRVDVQNILTVQGIPDDEYLHSWAKQLGVNDRLDLAIGNAGLGPGK